MPKPIQRHLAGHVKAAQIVFCASRWHDTSRTDVVDDLRVTDRLLRPATLDTKSGGVHEKHRYTTKAEPMGHGQAMVPVKDDVVDGVDHHT